MKQIFPLLGGGVLVAGLMLGRPGHEALITEHYIEGLVGGNSLWANPKFGRMRDVLVFLFYCSPLRAQLLISFKNGIEFHATQ